MHSYTSQDWPFFIGKIFGIFKSCWLADLYFTASSDSLLNKDISEMEKNDKTYNNHFSFLFHFRNEIMEGNLDRNKARIISEIRYID